MATVAAVRPVAARSHEPDCPLFDLLLQARDCARKLEALKPLFVEPRSKGSFSEVRVRWAPLPHGRPGLARAGSTGLWSCWPGLAASWRARAQGWWQQVPGRKALSPALCFLGN